MNVYKTKTRRVWATKFGENISFYYTQLKIVLKCSHGPLKANCKCKFKTRSFHFVRGYLIVEHSWGQAAYLFFGHCFCCFWVIISNLCYKIAILHFWTWLLLLPFATPPLVSPPTSISHFVFCILHSFSTLCLLPLSLSLSLSFGLFFNWHSFRLLGHAPPPSAPTPAPSLGI